MSNPREITKPRRVRDANVPGFFRSSELFYRMRDIDIEGVREVDDIIRPIQVSLLMLNKGKNFDPLEYTPPFIDLLPLIGEKQSLGMDVFSRQAA